MRLADYLPYLLNRIGPPLEDGFAAPLAAAGVSLQMWRVLAVLHEYGDQSVGDLSALTSIRLSTLSRLVGRMARRGLVARRRDGGDARAVIVGLRKAGAATAERLIPDALAYERRLTSGLTAAEIATLKRLLVRVYDGMAPEAGRP